MSACESLPVCLPAQIDSAARYDREWRLRLQTVGNNAVGGAGLMQFWERALHFFTNCAITKQSDKLIAIQGIADLINQSQGQNSGQWCDNQGLWAQSLVWELPWTVSEGQSASRPTHDVQLPGQNLNERDLRLSFPSWSWASIKDAAVDISRCRPIAGCEENNLFLAIPEIYTPSASNTANPSPKSKARLAVLCPVGRGWMHSDGRHLTLGEGKSAAVQIFPDMENTIPLESEHGFLILSVDRSLKQHGNGRVYTLPVRPIPEASYEYSGFGLMVNKKPESRRTYERTGVVRFILDANGWKEICQVCESDSDKIVEGILPLTRVEII
jgi:hypothetical protein